MREEQETETSGKAEGGNRDGERIIDIEGQKRGKMSKRAGSERDKRMWVSRAGGGSLRKAQTRRKEVGMAETNGEIKIWGKECGNRMSREGGGSAAGCGRPPSRASRFQRASYWKGSLKGQRPRQDQHHHWEDRQKKGTVSPAWRPEESVVS